MYEKSQENYRKLIYELKLQKILTYADMARKLNVSEDVLKAFATGRTKKPREGFLEQVHKRLPELKAYRLPNEATKLIDEIIGYHEQATLPFQVKALGGVMGIKPKQFKITANKFEGNYACYRHAGKANDIFKTNLIIHPYEPHIGVVSFTLKHCRDDGAEVMTTGYGVPVFEKLSLIGRVAGINSFFSMSIENNVSDNCYSGIFMQSIGNASGLCSRMLLKKISTDDRAHLFGVFKYSDISEEINGMKMCLDNEIREHEILRPYRSR